MPESSAQKTELPTPKKLRDARQKGQVCKSQDVNSTATIGMAFLFVLIAWPYYFSSLLASLDLPNLVYQKPFPEAVDFILQACLHNFIVLSFPIVLMVALTAVLSNFFQFGALLSFEAIKPNLSKLNPIEGFKKLFAIKNVIELIKSLLKVSFLGLWMAIILYHAMGSLLNLPYTGVKGIIASLSELTWSLATVTMIAFVIFAAADYFFQRWQFTKDLKMTKDEVKREYKEMEGDPIIKSKRRALAKEMAMNKNVEKARTATVLVTNPTHYAIALYYEKEKTLLPIVTAKGEGAEAAAMINAAREAGVPIMQNIPLAHALHDQAQVDQYISSDLIEPVAELLRYLQKLKDEGQIDT